MKLLCVLREPGAPSARYRVLQFVPFLEKSGAQVTCESLPSGWFSRRRLFRSAADADCVLLQKRLLLPGQVAYLRRYAKRLIYDFDDAVLYHDSQQKQAESATRKKRFMAIMSAADLVIAGNDYLRQLAEPHARKVIVLPTAIDPKKYETAAAGATNENGVVTLGWIGSKSTTYYLLSIKDALEQVGKLRKNVRLRLVCDTFPEFQNIMVDKKTWSEETEAADVASFDIGLAPAGDDPWSLGKCGLKILQYFAASKPVVCSPYGVNREMVRDGKNGYLAGDANEWRDKLIKLIDSPADRGRMGARSHDVMAERYSIARIGPKFVEAILGLV